LPFSVAGLKCQLFKMHRLAESSSCWFPLDDTILMSLTAPLASTVTATKVGFGAAGKLGIPAAHPGFAGTGGLGADVCANVGVARHRMKRVGSHFMQGSFLSARNATGLRRYFHPVASVNLGTSASQRVFAAIDMAEHMTVVAIRIQSRDLGHAPLYLPQSRSATTARYARPSQPTPAGLSSSKARRLSR
jgi:hypothetical protein